MDMNLLDGPKNPTGKGLTKPIKTIRPSFYPLQTQISLMPGRPPLTQVSLSHTPQHSFALERTRIIGTAVNTGTLDTTKARIGSHDFLLFRQKKSSLFNSHPVINAASNCFRSWRLHLFERSGFLFMLHLSSRYLGEVNFSLIDVASHRQDYYNCINISCLFLAPLWKIYSIESMLLPLYFSLETKFVISEQSCAHFCPFHHIPVTFSSSLQNMLHCFLKFEIV